MAKVKQEQDDTTDTRKAWVQFTVSAVRAALKTADITAVNQRATRNGFVLEILGPEGEEIGVFELKTPVVKPKGARAPAGLALGSGMTAQEASRVPTLPAGSLTLAGLGLAKVRCAGVPSALANTVVWTDAGEGMVEGLITAAHRPAVVEHDASAVFFPILMPAAGQGVVLGLRGLPEVAADLGRSIAQNLMRGEATVATHGTVSEVTLPPSTDEGAVATAISYAVEAGLSVTMTVRKVRKTRGA